MPQLRRVVSDSITHCAWQSCRTERITISALDITFGAQEQKSLLVGIEGSWLQKVILNQVRDEANVNLIMFGPPTSKSNSQASALTS